MGVDRRALTAIRQVDEPNPKGEEIRNKINNNVLDTTIVAKNVWPCNVTSCSILY